MNCAGCGHENREGAGFCRECSASLAPELECASCGQRSPPASRFCDGCGSPLAAPSAAAAPERGLRVVFRVVFLRDVVFLVMIFPQLLKPKAAVDTVVQVSLAEIIDRAMCVGPRARPMRVLCFEFRHCACTKVAILNR